MSDGTNGETDNPKGNQKVENSMNKDGGRDLKDQAPGPNHTGATMPDHHENTEDGGDEGGEKSDS
jgi:hypothetical protein